MERSELASPAGERLPLLSKTSLRSLRSRYRRAARCLSSKVALLILLWSFVVYTVYSALLSTLIEVGFIYIRISSKGVILYSYMALIYCVYPFAGYLADNKFGRYKTVTCSLRILIASLIILIPGVIFITVPNMVRSGALENGAKVFMTYLGEGIVLVGVFTCVVGTVGFSANVIQFGLDQLYDSPSEHQILLIHWFIWTYDLAKFVMSVVTKVILVSAKGSDSRGAYETLICLLVAVAFILVLAISLRVAKTRQNWFFVDPSKLNPYKLIYQVTEFSRKHKVPLRRSAFTYCEDTIPSGLDLGKSKYGGPFTTEQVEDVKSFYGVLKIVLSLGFGFFVISSADLVNFHLESSWSSLNGTKFSSSYVHQLFFRADVVPPFLVLLCVPLYLFLLRLLFYHCIPGMLRRIGLGVACAVMSVVSIAVIDSVSEAKHMNLGCMTAPHDLNSTRSNFPISPGLSTRKLSFSYLIPFFFISVSKMLIYIALYEFICSQSPHSMKGFLIGLSFVVRGLFQLIASIVILPFDVRWHRKALLGCDVVYYVINVAVGVLGLLVYMCVARRYKYWVKDETCHVYRYVEDYYTKIQQERVCASKARNI